MNFFKKVFGLIVSFSAYPAMGLQPVRTLLVFLLKVTALAAFILAAGLLPRLLFYSRDAATWLGENLPASSIVDGRFTTEAQLPITLKHRQFSISVVDAPETESPPEVNEERPIAIAFEPKQLRMLLYTADPDAEIIQQTFPFEYLPDGKVTTAYLEQLFSKMIWQSLPLEFLVFWLGSFAFAIGLALFLTAINRILVRITQRPDLPLIPMFNLCCLAQTPALLLTSAYFIMGMWNWQLQGIYFIIYTVYWIGGSIAFRKQIPWIAMAPVMPVRPRQDSNHSSGRQPDGEPGPQDQEENENREEQDGNASSGSDGGR